MARTTQEPDDGSDSDAVSITSTVASEPKEVYIVERILAEEQAKDGAIYYLIDWEGYPIERATWEPETHLVGNDLLLQWQTTKMKIARGMEDPFDVENWEKNQHLLEEERRRRKAKRKAKRKRLSITVSPKSASPATPSRKGSRASSPMVIESGSEREPSVNEPFVEHGPSNKHHGLDEIGFVVSDGRDDKDNDRNVDDRDQKTISPRKRGFSSSTTSSTGDSMIEDLQAEHLQRPNNPVKRTKPIHDSQKEMVGSANELNVLPSRSSSPPLLSKSLVPNPPMRMFREENSVGTIAPAPLSRTDTRKSSAENPGKVKRTGSDLFTKWDTSVVRRKSLSRPTSNPAVNQSGPKKFLLLSEARRYEKYIRNEPVPRFEDVEHLIQADEYRNSREDSPSSGGLFMSESAASLASEVTPSKEQSPDDTTDSPCETLNSGNNAIDLGRFNPASISDSSIMGMDRGSRLTNERQNSASKDTTTVPDAFRPRPRRESVDATEYPSLSSEAETGVEHRFTRPARRTTSQERQFQRTKIPLTCYHWEHGRCEFEDAECPFLHNHSKPVAHPELSAQLNIVPRLPKFARFDGPGLTCWYWYNIGCKKSIAECPFAHWNTGLVANTSKYARPTPVPVSQTTRQVSRRDRSTQASKSSNKVGVSQGQALGSPRAVCYFHAQGFCQYGSHCRHSHDTSSSVSREQTSTVGSQGSASKATGDSHNNGLPPPGYSANVSRAGTSGTTNQYRPSKGIEHETKSPPLKDTPANLDSVARPRPPPIDTSRANISSSYTSPKVDSGRPLSSALLSSKMNTSQDPLSGSAGQYIGARIQFPGLDKATEVKLTSSNGSSLHRAFEACGDQLNLTIKYSITPEDLKQYVGDDSQGDALIGDILPVDSSDSSIRLYISHLIDHASGGIAWDKDFSILVFPAKSELWSFLSSNNVPSKAALRFYLLTRLPEPPSRTISYPSQVPSNSVRLESILSTLIGRSPRTLFESNNASLDRAVFLLFDPRRTPELDFWEQCFHAIKARVYRSDTAGSWDYFSKKIQSGVVLIYPDIPLTHIPNMNFVIGYKTSVYQLKYDDATSNYECCQLLPHGALVLLTDELLYYRPDNAMKVIKDLAKKNDRGNWNRGSWKLSARPKVKRWLLDIIAEYGERRTSQKDLHIDTFVQLEKLVPGEDWDARDPSEPSERANLITPSPSEIPNYESLWARDETAANDALVDWFARYSALSVRNYRRFIVIHPVERPEWRQKYSMMDIVTPERYEKKYLVRRAEGAR